VPQSQEIPAGTPAEERRQHQRVKVSQPLKMEATLNGHFIEILRIEMVGKTIDMGPGGFRAHIDQSVLPGVRCRVELDTEDDKKPKSLVGRVLRTSADAGGFIVALEFNDPTEAAKILGSSDIGGKETARLELDPGDGSWKSSRARP